MGGKKEDMGQQKSKRSKRTHPQKSARQWFRTAKNTEKRRDMHAAKHPNDNQAVANWKDSPVKRSK
jgi:hypothetical protein